MEQKDQYISLQEAAKLCLYSQDYLSLRARQGKLKAQKIGRNWVTTEDWLKEYISKVEGFKNGLDVKKQKEVAVVKKQKVPKPISSDIKDIPPPLNLPVKDEIPILKTNIFFSPLGAGVATALLFLFVFSGVVFGRDGVMDFVNSARERSQNVVKEIVMATRNAQDLSIIDIKNVTYGLQSKADNNIIKAYDIIDIFTKEFSGGFEYAVKSPGAAGDFVGEYVDWVGESASAVPSNIGTQYSSVNVVVEDGIKDDIDGISQGYSNLNDDVNIAIGESFNSAKSLSNRVGNFFGSFPGRFFAAKDEPVQQPVEEIIEVVNEVEVERVIVVEPTREVIREVVRVDSEAIRDLKSQINVVLAWRGDIDRLQAITEKIQAGSPGVPVAISPIYVGSSGIQVGGNALFASLGVSGAAGIRDLGVGHSASFGVNSSDSFTVNSTATFNGSVSIGSGLTSSSLIVNGNTTLGDEASDTITFNASTLEIPNDFNIDSDTLFIDSTNNRVGIRTSTDVNSALTFASDTAAEGGILFGTDTNLYRSADNTLQTDDKFIAATGGLALDVQNTTDAASNQTAVFRGGNRVTPTNNDEGYASFTLDNSAGTQAEFARLAFGATDVTSSSKDGILTFSTQVADTLTDTLFITGGNVGIKDSAPSTLLSLGGTGSTNGITFGDDAADSANLYRSAANTITTDDSFIVGGDLVVSGTLVTGSTVAASFDSLTIGGGYGSTGVTISNTGNIQANGTLTIDSTTTLSGLATIAVGGLALDVQNTTDAASNQVSIFRGGNRATPANNDEGYVSFTLDNSAGTQAEFARLAFGATDVTSSSKDGILTFSTQVADTLTDTLSIVGGNVGIGTTSPDNILTLDDGSLSFSTGGGASDIILSRGAVNRLDLADGDTFRIIGGQFQLDIDDTGATQGIAFGSTQDVNLYRSAANTLKTDDKLIVETGALALDVQNTTDAASNQIATFRGGNRTTPVNNDEGYISFTLDDGGGTQAEVARIGFSIVDVVTSSKDGILTFSSESDNVITDTLYIRGGRVGIRDNDPSTVLSLGGTGAANGITLGDDGSDSVNLYRSAANTLKTDDNFIIGGDITITGLTTSNGSVVLGDTASDTITFVGVVDSNITPDASGTRDIGSSSKRWSTGYFDTVDAATLTGTVSGGSTTSSTWTINSDNVSANAEIAALAFETGSAVFNSTLQWNASGDAGRVVGFDDTNIFNYPISIYSEVSGGNQTFTSGSLFKYSQPVVHAITQSGTLVGVDVDFSSNITNATNNQTGVLVTLKDGSSSGTATGFDLNGTADYGIDLSGSTIGTADILLSNSETIDNTTDGTVNIGTTTLKLTGGTTLVSDQTTVAVFNTTTTTLNIGGVATTLNLGASTGTATINNATISFPNATSFTAGSSAASFDSLTVGGGYGSTGVTISNTGNIQANGTLTIDSTTTLSGLATIAVGGLALDVQNTTDAASNQVSIFRGGNRATPTNNDEGYVSFTLDNSAGTQAEFARLAFGATDVTSSSKDGILTFSTQVADTLTDTLSVTGGRVGIGTATPAATLDVNNTAGSAIRLFANTGAWDSYMTFDDQAGQEWSIGSVNASGSFVIADSSSLSSNERLVIDSTGLVGIGTTAPDAALEINHATGDSLRLTYNDSDGSATNYTDFSLASDGDLTIAPSGGDSNITGTLDVSGHAAFGSSGSVQTISTVYVNESYSDDSNAIVGINSLLSYTGTSNSNGNGYAAIKGTGQLNSDGTILKLFGIRGQIAIGSGSTSGTVTTANALLASQPTYAGTGTLTTANGLTVNNQGSASVVSANGILIASPTNATTNNIGLRITGTPSGGSTINVAVQLADTGGTAAGGILFGTDTNLYRSAANTLRTDDTFSVGGDLALTGDITGATGGTFGNIQIGVTGDNEIDTSSGNLTLDSAGGTITLDDAVAITSTLDVQGGNITLQNDETIANSTNTEIAFSGGTNTLTLDFDEDSGTAIDLTTNGSIDLTFNPGGNVGIGTTSPVRKLDVFGDNTVNGAISAAGSTGAHRVNIWSNDGIGFIDSGSSGNVTLTINQGGGNVGIGTIAPDAALEINHATGDSLRLTYNDSNGSATNYTDFSLSSTGALTLTGSATSIASASGAEKTFLTLTPGTITLTGTTQVTSLMETAVLTGATITDSSAVTVNKATTLSLTAPVEAGSVTLTSTSALRVLNTSGTPSNQYGLFVEDMTSGAAGDYGIYVAGADTYALYVAADDVALLDDLFVGATTETLANTGFSLDGDDLFVAGMAGIEGNVYTDGAFIAGSGTSILADGSLSIYNDNSFIKIYSEASSGSLTTSGNEITDETRSTNTQGDGVAPPDSSYGIWEATTNLVTNGGFETNTTGWSQGGNMDPIARSTEQAKFGSASAKTVAASTAAGVNTFASFGMTFTDAIHVWSSWVYIPSSWTGGDVILTVVNLTGGSTSSLVDVDMNLRDQWQRLELQVTPDAGDLIGQLRVGTSGGIVEDEFVYVDGGQTELQPIATPYVETDGGTASRSAARVQAPVALGGTDIVDETQSWVAVRFRVGWDYNKEPYEWLRIWEWADDTNNRLTLYYNQSGDDWGMTTYNGGVNDSVNSAAQTFSKGDIITIVAKWELADLGISTDGSSFVLEGDRDGGISTFSATTSDFMRQNPFASSYGDSDILWAAFGTGTLSDADAATIDAFGNSDPKLSDFPSTAQATLVWKADDDQYQGTNPTSRTTLAIDDTNLYRSAANVLRTDDAFSVGGALTVTGGTTLSGDIILQSGETISNATDTEIALSDGTNTLTLDFDEDTATAIDLTTNGSIDLTFNPGGNVGIGTVTPGADLHVLAGTGNVVIGEPYSGFGGIGFGSSFSSNNHSLLGNGSDTYLNSPSGGNIYFRNNNSDQAILTSTGDFGINTTAPQSLLDVQGDAGAAGILTLASKELTVVDGDILGQINFNAPLESDGLDAILVGASIWAEADATFGIAANNTELVFATGSSATATEKVRIDSAGNVGIGTATPEKNLVILAPSGVTSTLRLDTTDYNDDSRIEFSEGGSYAHGAFLHFDSTANQFQIGTRLSNVETVALTIKGNINVGSIGIGTIAPDARLEINHATGDSLRLTYNDSDGSATNYTDFSLASDGDLTIAPSGGDSNITGTLDVSGHGAFGGSASISTSQTLQVAETYTSTSGNLWGGNFSTTLTPSSASSAEVRGVQSIVNTTANVNLTGAIVGSYIDARTNISPGASSTISNLYGQQVNIGIGSSATAGATVNSAAGIAVNGTNLKASTTIANFRGIAVNAIIATGTITNSWGIDVANYAADNNTSYGLLVQDQTATGGSHYGLAIAGADTQALWVGSGADNTDAANGIAFGSSRDTNLYRSAADTLKTDDSFLSLGTIRSRTSAGVGSAYAFIVDAAEADFRWRLRNDGYTEWGDGAGAFDTVLYRSAANTLKTDDSFIVGTDLTVSGTTITASSAALAIDSLTVGGGYGSTGVSISNTGNIQANGTLTIDSTTTLSGLATIAVGGLALDVQNTTDAASNQVSIFRGGNRTTPTNNDEGYVSFTLDNSAGTQAEFARLAFGATDVTSSSKDGILTFSTQVADTLTDTLSIVGGKVGIGTTTPGALLHIKELAAGGPELIIEEAASNASAMVRFTNTARSWDVGSDSTPDIFFIDTGGGQDEFVIDSSGNVGIGTTTPTGKLGLFAGPSDGVNVLAFQELTGDDTFYLEANYAGTGTTGNWLTMKDWSGHDVMTWRGDGNVGINTTAPQSLLDVQGDAGAAGILTLASKELTVVDGDVLGQINFNAPLESDGSDAILVGASIWAEADATFGIAANNTELVFATGSSATATEKVRIDSAGNVGIGTSTPSEKLEIDGNIAFTSADTGIKTGQRRLDIISDGGTNSYKINDNSGGDTWFHIDTNSGYVLMPTGSVGIGTTGPDAPLDVLSTGGTQLRLTYADGSTYTNFNTDTNGDLTIAPSGGDSNITGTLDVSGHVAFGSAASVASGDIIVAQDSNSGTVGPYRGFVLTQTQSSELTSGSENITGLSIASSFSASTVNNDNSLTGIYASPRNTGTGTLGNVKGLQVAIQNNSTGVIANAYSLQVVNPANAGGGTIITNYGLLVSDQTSGASDYGIAIAGADTQALWISSGADNTDAANGIAFGSSRDTNLYRSAANTLKTDDSFTVGTDLTVSGNDITFGNGEAISNATDDTIILTSNASGGAGALRLPVKTTTGDPTLNVEGNVYYNTFDNKFRCYEESAWADCIGGGGAQTPWTSDIDADGFDLNDLSNIEFRDTAGAPAGTITAIFRDNTGDLNLNALTGKTVNLQVNATDEYNFSSTGLEFNANNITGLGDIAVNGGDITTDQTTFNLVNATATTVNVGGAATTIELGDTTGTTSVNNALAVDGNTTLGNSNTVDTLTGNLLTSAITSGATTQTAFTLTADSVTTGIGQLISIDGLTTGTGFSVASTSTALTTGGLGLFDWSPGSAITASGDLFTINIGTNGTTTGNLFTVQDTGSDLFSVSETAITSALPHSFTAAGDVTIAYDIIFSNQTSSFIKSNAPLYFEAGETFESNNLTLRTYNSGNIVFDNGTNGQIAVFKGATGSAVFDGAVAVGAQDTLVDSDATPDVSGGSHFITNTTAVTITDFDAGSGTLEAGQVIYVESNGAITYDVTASGLNGGAADFVTAAGDTTTWIYDGGDWNLISWMDDSDTQTGADIAELFLSDEELDNGDIVSVSATSSVHVKKSTGPYDSQLIGIVSTKPGIVLSDDFPANEEGSLAYPIALAGRVPTKVSAENGPIAAGDPITASSIPGIGMKANQSGRVVGIALESFDPDSVTEIIEPLVEEDLIIDPLAVDPVVDPVEVDPIAVDPLSADLGTILVFINPHWIGNDLTVSENTSGEIVIIDSPIAQELASVGLIVDNFGQLTLDSLKADKVTIQRLEIIDQGTGELYCTWLEYGEWVKVQGECGTTEVSPSQDPLADITVPVISLIGSDNIEIEVDSIYEDQGATAEDDVDGDITSSIIVDNPVNISFVGTYIISYNVSDVAGNIATTVERTVSVLSAVSEPPVEEPPVEEPPVEEPPAEEPPVEEPSVDTTLPIISLIGSDNIEIEVDSIYEDQGATAEDDVDGDITVNIVTDDSVDTSLEGAYIVTYNITDVAGNSADEVTRTVTVIAAVVDITAPVITITGQTVVEVEVGVAYEDQGATAEDDVDGDITSNIITDNSVDTSVAGTYTILYNVSDLAGNAAITVERTVNIIELPVEEPPVEEIIL